MKNPILRLIANEPLDDDYDPILGRVVRKDEQIENQSEEAPLTGSVFDDPDLDFAYQPAPIVPEVQSTPLAPEPEPEPVEAFAPEIVEIEELIAPVSEHAQNPQDAAQEEEIPEPHFIEPELLAEPELVSEPEQEPEPEPEPEIAEEVPLQAPLFEEEEVISEDLAPEEPIIATDEDAETITEDENANLQENIVEIEEVELESTFADRNEEIEAPETIEEYKPEYDDGDWENTSPPNFEKFEEEPKQDTLLDEPALTQFSNDAPKAEKPKPVKKRKKRKPTIKKKGAIALFIGIVLTGITTLMTFFAMLEPLGPPFDAIAESRWIWLGIAVLGSLVWAFARNYLLAIITFAVALINALVILPQLGSVPSGGQPSHIIGFGNIGGNSDNFNKLLNDADKKGAEILFVSGTGQQSFTPPHGWTIISNSIANDPSSFTIMAKTRWASSAVYGEPVIARPLDNSFTILALNPIAANRKSRENLDRDSLINRAANRAGIEETPVLIIGDMDTVAWAKNMQEFASNGAVKRVMCDGFLGLSQDNIYARDLKINKCDMGRKMKNTNHNSIWIGVSPKN